MSIFEWSETTINGVSTNSAFKFYNPNSPQYVEKIMDGHNNLKFEWHNRNLNSEDMSKYIHNLMKEKLDGVSVRLVD